MPADEPANQLEVDLDTFADAHAAGAVVLDVRQPDEYEAAHVAGAKLLPLDQLAARQDEVPDGVGGRSLAAATALSGAGYRAVSVAGGTNGWMAQGRPVVTGTSER